MSDSVASRLAEVNFCPILVSREGAYTYDFPGGWAQPMAPTIYTSVDEFCEFLRTLAALHGDHAVRRSWIGCLRGAAHSWFYHTLPMGTRKYIVDAHISEVITFLTEEFKQYQYLPSSGFTYGTHDFLANGSESGYEESPQGTAIKTVDSSATTPQSSHITLSVRPAPNQLIPPPMDGHCADRVTMDPRTKSWSPQRGRRSGSRIPRSPGQSPPADDGTPLLSPEIAHCEMVHSEYPTHADVVAEEGNMNGRANDRSNGHANGHANGHVSGNGLTGRRASRVREGRSKPDLDCEMFDAPRTPRKIEGRFHKSLSPEKGRSGVSKSRSPPKRLTVRNAGASELASIVVDGSSRRTRSSSA